MHDNLFTGITWKMQSIPNEDQTESLGFIKCGLRDKNKIYKILVISKIHTKYSVYNPKKKNGNRGSPTPMPRQLPGGINGAPAKLFIVPVHTVSSTPAYGFGKA